MGKNKKRSSLKSYYKRILSVMFLNSQLFQNNELSNSNDRKNVCFSTKTDIFFNCSTLTARHFGTSESSEALCTSFKALISDKVDLATHGHGSTVTFYQALLKKAILHLKTLMVWKFFCLSLSVVPLCNHI